MGYTVFCSDTKPASAIQLLAAGRRGICGSCIPCESYILRYTRQGIRSVDITSREANESSYQKKGRDLRCHINLLVRNSQMERFEICFLLPLPMVKR